MKPELRFTMKHDNPERRLLFTKFASSPSHERLAVARYLSSIATMQDVRALQAILEKESVSFIKQSLRQTIERLAGNEPAHQPEMPEQEQELALTAKARQTKAVSVVTETLLHEILPRIGAIEYEASKAIANYESSRLKLKIDHLNDLMKGLEELKDATLSSSISEIALRGHLENCVSNLMLPSKAKVLFEGREDLVAVGDGNLLSIAFCNGLRNAVEAAGAVEGGAVIIVAWGETDVDYWVDVIDNGPGLSGTAEAAFQLGRSSKQGHRGFGLSIARQSMATMDGSVALKPNKALGTVFELRWFK